MESDKRRVEKKDHHICINGSIGEGDKNKLVFVGFIGICGVYRFLKSGF